MSDINMNQSTLNTNIIKWNHITDDPNCYGTIRNGTVNNKKIECFRRKRGDDTYYECSIDNKFIGTPFHTLNTAIVSASDLYKK